MQTRFCVWKEGGGAEGVVGGGVVQVVYLSRLGRHEECLAVS
jgi:hypothetical protein